MQSAWLALTNRKISLPLAASLCAYFIVLLRTAWLAEDAFITFRTIDNFIHGYGLTWNVTERVQGFTNPLWMFLISAFYFVTREIYYTAIFVSVAVSLVAVLVLTFRIAASQTAAALAVVALIFSRAFVDYSTSGLENPLTHAILALFLAIYLRQKLIDENLFLLSLVAAFGALNRMDTILFYLPPLAYLLWQLRSLQSLYRVLAGFLPLILWEIFSLFYYGFPFPNTAYAKLNTGIPVSELAYQGLHYLLVAIQGDPLTPIAAIVGIAIPLGIKSTRQVPAALGILLYLLYVIRVGGDFMSGRFLAAPFFVAVALMAFNARFTSFKLWSGAVAGVLVLGLSSPYPPLLSGADYGVGLDDLNERGVNDERGLYYQNAGLLKALQKDQESEFPDHWFAARGREVNRHTRSMTIKHSGQYVAAEGFLIAPVDGDRIKAITTWMNVGYASFYGGPRIHIVDAMALVEPLLARLPARADPEWGPGHFSRIMPEGYVETHIQGKNIIADEDLALFYDKLCHITKGDLWDPQRWIEIWNMNRGKYDHLIHFERYRHPSHLERCLSEVRIRPGDPSKHLDLGKAYFDAGFDKKAIDALHYSLRLNPLSFNNHYYAGQIFSKYQQRDLANAAYRRAINISPWVIRGAELNGNQDKLCQTYTYLAQAYEATGNRTAAFRSAENVLRIKPEAEMFYNLGLLYYKDGQFDNAVAAYRKAIGLDRENSGFYVDLGTALRAQGRLMEAKNAYEAAIRLQPDQALFHHNLGGLEVELGNRQVALEAFQRSTNLRSKNIQTYVALSRLYLATGQPKQALAVYRNILKNFGETKAEQSGIKDDLRNLMTRGLYKEEAKIILNAYWPPEAEDEKEQL